MDIKEYYQQQKQQSVSELESVRKKIRKTSFLRVALFISGCIGVFYLYPYGTWAIISVIICILIPFLGLIKYHNRLFHAQDWWKASITHYQNEIEALQGNVSAYDEGKEYIDPKHPYSLDLDIFGERSVFQTINRTCTPFGKDTLAQWMNQHLKDQKEIEKRQKAVKELAKHKEFRERFRITGMLFKGKGNCIQDMEEWVNAPDYFSTKKWYRWMTGIVPGINLVLFLLGITGIVSMNWIGFSIGCFLIASFGFVKKVTQIQSDYEKHLMALSTYIKLIQLTETEELESPLLIEWKDRFKNNGIQATQALSILAKELERLELRNNQLLYFVLEGILFWQIRQMLRIEQWKRTYGKPLIEWLNTLGKVDAMNSLATFAFNRPDYAYPIITDQPFIFQAKGMGHPLMPPTQCVKNDAEIPSRPYFIIITGANMAGKSTYLRTIGTNYLLACIGAPVCCGSLTLYPAQLMTSLRTNDSLNENESYFFAELKRLKQIIDRLQKGEEMFIILDEILKGTNSIDKQKGSFAFIQQLMNLQTNGIIATHDLALGKLATDFPENIKNHCFEADIIDNELSFSYQLRNGLAQNMNACFLMKKMGLIIND